MSGGLKPSASYSPRARVVIEHFERELAAALLACPIGDRAQQCPPDPAATPLGPHRQVVDVHQWQRREGREAAEAYRHAHRVRAIPGEEDERPGEPAQARDQRGTHRGGQRLAAAHEIAGVAVDQLDDGLGLRTIIEVGARHAQVHG